MKLGVIIEDLGKLKDKQKILTKKLTDLKAEIMAAEGMIIEELDKQGLKKSTGASATVSIITSVKPQVEDWELFYAFIHRRKFYHLLDRRPSVLGCRELFESKGKIPGVSPFTARKLSFTKAT